jgi:nucleoside-diphosphate-sugar epimerase
MKILITGASGFVGKNLLERYSAHHQVCGFYQGQNLDAVLADFVPDVVLHCAAEIYNVDLMPASNVSMTMTLVEWIRRHRATMINFGSSSEYGFRDCVTSESVAIEPHTAYAGTKAACTYICSGYAREFNLDIVTLRLYSIYGPHEKPHRLFPRLWKAFMLDQPMQLVNGVHDFVYIRDLVDAVDLVVSSDKRSPGEIINVANGVQYTNAQVLHMFESVVGRVAPIDFDPDQFVTQPVWRGNSDLLKNKYQWRPKYDLRAGVTEFIWQAKYE